ncbi:MATE family efflux transporter [Epibacterium ulvae]|uniref:MATE family efflux transporter n=1 Tax=Epibacterium ulvae TaxID=1156985 RepID=UPI0024914E35|nr:MATE family efflux transporter [Epibacterium ulvae]
MTQTLFQTPQMTAAGHVRAIAILGLPLIGGHLAQFAIGLTDTIMLGWYGVEALAAVTLASSYFMAVFLFGSGFANAVMPIVAAAVGSGDTRQVRRATRMGLWLSLVFCALAMPLFIWAEPIFLLIGQKPEVAALADDYLAIAGWGLFPALMVVVLKSYLAALERTQVVLWITLLAAAVNALANYMLIFGHWGAPELGLAGAALASVATQMASLVAVFLYCRRALVEHALFDNLHRGDPEMLLQVLRIGLPIGLTTLFEASLFTASAVMMGWLGAVPLAAHGIAVSLAGVTFMVHVGLSNAATIRAGNAFGRRDRAHLERGAFVVTCLSLMVSAVAVSLFVFIPETLISIFLDQNEPSRIEILQVGIGLLLVAAFFQLTDGFQVIALGLLRGLQDTGSPMMIAVFSYWGVGLPASYIMGFVFDWGGIGIWIGLVAGLTTAGILLTWRFWRYSIRQV